MRELKLKQLKKQFDTKEKMKELALQVLTDREMERQAKTKGQERPGGRATSSTISTDPVTGKPVSSIKGADDAPRFRGQENFENERNLEHQKTVEKHDTKLESMSMQQIHNFLAYLTSE